MESTDDSATMSPATRTRVKIAVFSYKKKKKKPMMKMSKFGHTNLLSEQKILQLPSAT